MYFVVGRKFQKNKIKNCLHSQSVTHKIDNKKAIANNSVQNSESDNNLSGISKKKEKKKLLYL